MNRRDRGHAGRGHLPLRSRWGRWTHSVPVCCLLAPGLMRRGPEPHRDRRRHPFRGVKSLTG